MKVITKEKLKVFENYQGDEDHFARAGRRREKELFDIHDWGIINDFKQRLEMIQKGLTSIEFQTKTIEELKVITDSASFDSLTKTMER